MEADELIVPSYSEPAVLQSQDDDAETVTFIVNTVEAGREASLHITYLGRLQDNPTGFFSSNFTRPDGSTGVIATTHFEPTYARKMFPCFDDPSLKATFGITLIADKNMTCISNAAVSEVTFSKVTKKQHVKFHNTPPMSTYLVAAAVGELSYIENTESRIPIRVYTSPATDPEQCAYLAHTLARGIKFYEELFDIEYELPKLDVLAAPSFMSGAMENWGLIISTAAYVPYDPKRDGQQKKETIAAIMLHELAHQWFGNLVTLQWWDQTWLNEGG